MTTVVVAKKIIAITGTWYSACRTISVSNNDGKYTVNTRTDINFYKILYCYHHLNLTLPKCEFH